MANSWILNRLREIEEKSKEWPAWVFEQPLSCRDAEKIARGERLRSAAMAEDVLGGPCCACCTVTHSTEDAGTMEYDGRQIPTVRDVWSCRDCGRRFVFESEVRELRKFRAIAENFVNESHEHPIGLGRAAEYVAQFDSAMAAERERSDGE